MSIPNANKRRLVISFHNLPTELQDEVKKIYPTGFMDAMTRIDKPNGDFFYVVPFETDEVSYMVKVDVKVDDHLDEEEDKEYFNDEIKGADDYADSSSDEEEESNDDDIDV